MISYLDIIVIEICNMEYGMKKIILIVVCFVFFLGIFIESTQALLTNLIYVDDDYNISTSGWGIDHFDRIQDAINAAENNDTIYVFNGAYYEHLNINKSILLLGENKVNVIIDGSRINDVIVTNADNVTISNCTIQYSGSHLNNSGIKIVANKTNVFNTRLLNNSVGIHLLNCNNNSIEQNIAENNLYGIGVEYGNGNNSIKNNSVMSNNITGIYLTYCSYDIIYGNSAINNKYGIALSYSCNNKIGNNFCSNNMKDGITLFFCNKSEIYQNTITSSMLGISLTSSNRNNIFSNSIIINNNTGVKITLESNNNALYCNQISQNYIGIHISVDSHENTYINNIFSQNSIKLLDESVTIKNKTTGFELFLLILTIIFVIFIKRKRG